MFALRTQDSDARWLGIVDREVGREEGAGVEVEGEEEGGGDEKCDSVSVQRHLSRTEMLSTKRRRGDLSSISM